MIRYSTCLRTLLTVLIVLAGLSSSEAGLFGRWRRRSEVSARPTATVATPSAAAISPVGQPATSAAGPTVYTVAKPVVGETAASAAAPAAPAGSFVPASAVSPGATWSTLPRSSWDFGKYPPYSN
jgi:hypothetical protein